MLLSAGGALRVSTLLVREYIALEEIASVRDEFLDEHVWAMAGGTPEPIPRMAAAAKHESEPV